MNSIFKATCVAIMISSIFSMLDGSLPSSKPLPTHLTYKPREAQYLKFGVAHEIPTLTKKQIEALSPQQFNELNPDDVSTFTDQQLEYFTNNQLERFDVTKFSLFQLGELYAIQTQNPNMSSEIVEKIRQTALKKENERSGEEDRASNELKKATNEAMQKLTPSDIRNLDKERIKNFTPLEINALSKNQIHALSDTQLNVLKEKQIAHIPVQNFSDSQIQQIFFKLSEAQIRDLSKKQIQDTSIGTLKAAAVHHNLSFIDPSKLSLDQVTALFSELSRDQVYNLPKNIVQQIPLNTLQDSINQNEINAQNLSKDQLQALLPQKNVPSPFRLLRPHQILSLLSDNNYDQKIDFEHAKWLVAQHGFSTNDLIHNQKLLRQLSEKPH